VGRLRKLPMGEDYLAAFTVVTSCFGEPPSLSAGCYLLDRPQGLKTEKTCEFAELRP